MISAPDGGWGSWTVILLKPDCLARNLVDEVLAMVAQELTVLHVTKIFPTEHQIFLHYSDILARSAELGRDVPAELRRIYVGKPAAVALGHGHGAAPRLRRLLGPTDPAACGPDTIRGRFAADSLQQASAEGRLIDNLIHSSDTAAVAPVDFDNWYGHTQRNLLRAPTPSRANGETR
jgi:nucleoside-diphosphate kinase